MDAALCEVYVGPVKGINAKDLSLDMIIAMYDISVHNIYLLHLDSISGAVVFLSFPFLGELVGCYIDGKQQYFEQEGLLRLVSDVIAKGCRVFAFESFNTFDSWFFNFYGKVVVPAREKALGYTTYSK
ncbi:MAG: hypothetical protein GY861_21850 [bacterium]|nr:hypothetical protein [bacterium]